MKVLPFKISKESCKTLTVEEEKKFCFYDKLHQHEEIQISYILSGKGTFIVGDTVKNYQQNDILIFGTNVPHVLNSNLEMSSHMISIFFTPDCFGHDFFELEELLVIKTLLKKSDLGIKVTDTSQELKNMFFQLTKQHDLKQIISFLKILNKIITFKYDTIANFNAKKMYSDYEGKRMSSVFELVLNNYHKDISLDEIAEITNMSPNAFCRYFKKRLNKTFVQFLTEIRVENSCRLLSLHRDLTIAEVAYQCGFKNISNYNQKFKTIKLSTPSSYRKKMAI